MKNMGKTLRIAHHKGEEPESAINNYLQSYRTTPHPSTGETPAALLFQGRQFGTKLPQLRKTYDVHNIKQKDQQYKSTLLAQHNKKYSQQHSFHRGDAVLKQNGVRKKHDFVYDPIPWTITSTKGSRVEIQKGKKTLLRHGNNLKLVNPPTISTRTRSRKDSWQQSPSSDSDWSTNNSQSQKWTTQTQKHQNQQQKIPT